MTAEANSYVDGDGGNRTHAPFRALSLGALAALLTFLLAASASAGQKRIQLKGESTKVWTTQQVFAADATVVLAVYVNGRLGYDADGGNDPEPQRPAWAARGVFVEAQVRRRRGPVTFRMANVRGRDARVRLVWRIERGGR